MEDLNNLKPLEKDALGEMGNIGAGNAATALSQMIGSTIALDVPRVSVIPVKDIPQPLGGPETIVAGIYLKLFGDAPGRMLICMPQETVFPLLKLMFANIHQNIQELGEQEQSALKEMGNIVGCAYLNAMVSLMGLQLVPSVPALAVDMVDSVISTVMSEMAQKQPQALLVETEFSGLEGQLKLHLFYIPEQGSVANILGGLHQATGLDPSKG